MPNTPVEYDRHMLDQLTNILRIYFNELDNFTQSLISGDGGKFLSAPYGAFQDTTTQTAVINTATPMQFDTVDFANEVYISGGTKIRVDNAGIYNLQWSAQFENTDNAPHDISVWLRQGNDGGTAVDIPGSTGVLGLPPRKSIGDPFHSVFGWNYFVSLNIDDFIEIYWSTDSALVLMPAYPISGAPVRPTTASVVVSMSFVSALP